MDPDRDNPKRIALFGGTFDPIHHGHIELLRSLDNSRMIDASWILPAPDPPHKRGSASSSYSHRLQMIRLALEDIDVPVSVCEVEMELPTPSYTIQTVRHVQARYPRYRFFLSIGADSLNQFHTWKSYKELLQRVSLLVARRPGWTDEVTDPAILERTLFLDHSEMEISSSRIRREISAMSGSLDQVHRKLPNSVWSYIQQQNLYRNG